LLNKVT